MRLDTLKKKDQAADAPLTTKVNHAGGSFTIWFRPEARAATDFTGAPEDFLAWAVTGWDVVDEYARPVPWTADISRALDDAARGAILTAVRQKPAAPGKARKKKET
jgi:hypothetical protein